MGISLPLPPHLQQLIRVGLGTFRPSRSVGSGGPHGGGQMGMLKAMAAAAATIKFPEIILGYGLTFK